jgi:hypothetical protein
MLIYNNKKDLKNQAFVYSVILGPHRGEGSFKTDVEDINNVATNSQDTGFERSFGLLASG